MTWICKYEKMKQIDKLKSFVESYKLEKPKYLYPKTFIASFSTLR